MKSFCFALLALFTASLVFSADLQVISPNGGETWLRGRTQTITWRAQGVPGNVRLILLKQGQRLGIIAENVPASAGSYSWTVGSYKSGETLVQADFGSNYKIRIRAVGSTAEDESNRHFTIADPHPTGQAMVRKTITVTAPNGGETWRSGETKSINWSSNEVTEPYCVALLKGGTEIGIIADNIPAGQRALSWHVGDPLVGGRTYGQGNDYRVQVRARSGEPKDDSNGPFTLSFVQAASPAAKVLGTPSAPPTIKVLSPNGGESYFTGNEMTVRYQTESAIDRVTINLIRKTPTVFFTNICSNSPNNGAHVFQIPNVIGAGRDPGTWVIEANGHVSGDTWVKDESDRAFSIQKGLDLELWLRDLCIYSRKRGTDFWGVAASLVVPGYGPVEGSQAADTVSFRVHVELGIKNTGAEWPRVPLIVPWRIKIINAVTHADFMIKVGALELITTGESVAASADLILAGSVRGVFDVEIQADPDNSCQEADFVRGDNKITRTFVIQ
jgi:hypothetical protein